MGEEEQEEELKALRQRAMRAAEAYGCHAGIEVMDFLDSADDPPGSLHLKFVVARLSSSGKLLSPTSLTSFYEQAISRRRSSGSCAKRAAELVDPDVMSNKATL